MTKKKPLLNDQQLAFCREYIIDFNGRQAAVRAGYSKKTAAATASRLLNNVNIQAEMLRLKDERAERTDITADMVVRQLARIAFMDIRDVVDWGTEDRTVDYKTNKKGEKVPIKEPFDYVRLNDKENVDGTLIQSVKMSKYGMSVELVDRARALEMLAKHTGVYDDRPQAVVDVTAYKEALWERASQGDMWEGFKNESPDGVDGDGDDGED